MSRESRAEILDPRHPPAPKAFYKKASELEDTLCPDSGTLGPPWRGIEIDKEMLDFQAGALDCADTACCRTERVLSR